MEMTFVKTTSVNLNQVPVVDGQFIVTSDTSQRFLDFDSVREGIASQNEIEAIENVLGAKNQFALAYNLGTIGVSTANDELKNTLTDTLSAFVLHFRGIKNDDTQDFLFRDVISSAGKYEYTVIITSNYKSLCFKHNGASQDLGIYIPAVATGRWILSFNVVGYNPSVVGGLEITEIMLRPAGTDGTYVPYAMTNRELTERVILEKEVDISGTQVTYFENGVYYTETTQLVEVATGAHIVEVSQSEGAWMPNVSYMILKSGDSDVIALTTPQSFTVPNNMKLYVKYWL